jgi:hypothetical protein
MKPCGERGRGVSNPGGGGQRASARAGGRACAPRRAPPGARRAADLKVDREHAPNRLGRVARVFDHHLEALHGPQQRPDDQQHRHLVHRPRGGVGQRAHGERRRVDLGPQPRQHRARPRARRRRRRRCSPVRPRWRRARPAPAAARRREGRNPPCAPARAPSRGGAAGQRGGPLLHSKPPRARDPARGRLGVYRDRRFECDGPDGPVAVAGGGWRGAGRGGARARRGANWNEETSDARLGDGYWGARGFGAAPVAVGRRLGPPRARHSPPHAPAPLLLRPSAGQEPLPS